MRLAAFLMLTFAPAAFACSCAGDGRCPTLGTPASPVFTGTVVSADKANHRVRVQILKSYGGLPPGTREVDLANGYPMLGCSFAFVAGKTYLISAETNAGALRTGCCSLNRDVESARALLRVLDRLLAGGTPPSLTGLLKFRLTPPGQHLSNRRIRLQSGDRVYETRTGGYGVYAFDSLPPGHYRILPDLPPGARQAVYAVFNDQRPIPIRGGACVEYDIRLLPSGSIEGRIEDATGSNAEPVHVYLLPAELELPDNQRQLASVTSREDGTFRFDHVPPGAYVLLVNPENVVSYYAPYLRRYYPGAAQRASARIVTVRGGEQISGADIQVERTYVRRITVRVHWSDGRPVEGALIRATASGDPDGDARLLGSDKVVLGLRPDRRYRLWAEVPCLDVDGMERSAVSPLRSSEVVIAPGPAATTVALTLLATGCPDVLRQP